MTSEERYQKAKAEGMPDLEGDDDDNGAVADSKRERTHREEQEDKSRRLFVWKMTEDLRWIRSPASPPVSEAVASTQSSVASLQRPDSPHESGTMADSEGSTSTSTDLDKPRRLYGPAPPFPHFSSLSPFRSAPLQPPNSGESSRTLEERLHDFDESSSEDFPKEYFFYEDGALIHKKVVYKPSTPSSSPTKSASSSPTKSGDH